MKDVYDGGGGDASASLVRRAGAAALHVRMAGAAAVHVRMAGAVAVPSAS